MTQERNEAKPAPTRPAQAERQADRQAEREAALIASLTAAGYARAEPSILQPANVFLDLSGEDIRGRLYLTSDAGGGDFCLRPEYTIPVCRDYLASDKVGAPAAFSYLGPVFRFRPNGAGEFHQAGVENFGRADREAADAEIFTLAMQAAEIGGAQGLRVRMGDAGLFTALLDGLKLDPAWLRRLRRGVARGQSLDAILTPAQRNGAADRHAGVLAALEGADRQGARALVEDLLAIAGISSMSGRSAGEIAERFLEQSALASAPFSAEKRAVLETFIAVAGHPDAASARLRRLDAEAKLHLGAALDEFDARIGFIAARGFDLARIDFSAAFARHLDYYTGFVFEAQHAQGDGRPVVGGGRYDGLMRALGGRGDIPAVGAAIWCDRLAQGAGA